MQINESESFEHLRIKEFLFENLPLENNIIEIKQEYKIGGRKADLFLLLPKTKKIVIEIQHSIILQKELLQRTQDYNNHDCYVLWLFNGNSFGRYAHFESAVQIYNFELISQSLYKGRVYFLNVSKSGLMNAIYTLYFAPYYEIKQFSNCKTHLIQSKTKKSIIPYPITSLKFKFFKNKGYKLVKFDDIDIRSRCILDIKTFLSEYPYLEKKLNQENELNAHQKKLFIIIAKFAPIYGIHLTYNILKNLGVVERNDFNFMNLTYDYLFKKIQ